MSSAVASAVAGATYLVLPTKLGQSRDKLKANVSLASSFTFNPLRIESRPRAATRSVRSLVVSNVASGVLSDSESSPSYFARERPLNGPQSFVRALPGSARVPVCAAIILAAAGAGFVAGGQIRPPLGQFVGAAVLGALGAAASHVLNEANKEVAAADLFNTVVAMGDPSRLTKAEVAAIAGKNGVSVEDARFKQELLNIYESFIMSTIPAGNEPLRGSEAAAIAGFKDALGLEDDDAAGVHIEAGRRIFRQRLETSDKDAAFGERLLFQKLVYISSLVFGEKSKFLLPWKRLFKVTDSQIEVAVRKNAEQLFQDRLVATRAEPDPVLLEDLRRFQLQIKLPDENAADMFRAEARKRVEAFINEALEVLKARTRVKNIAKVIADLDALRGYNTQLAEVAKQFPEGQLVPGVGPVSVFGGGFDEGRQMDDLKLLYQTYLSDALNADSLADAKVEALAELRNVFGMGRKEAEDVALETTSRVYRRRLAAAAQPGAALEAAASKAAFLEELCDKLRFDPEKAFEIHEEIYRQKLQQCLEDKALSDDDVAALNRLRVLLCVPKSVVDKAHSEICGGIFAKIVDDAIGAGVDGYDADMKEAVQKAAKGLRLPQESALEIAAKAVRSIFLTYIKRARSTMGRAEGARELKKMVLFSNLTVSQLIADIKGEQAAEETKPEEAAAAEEAVVEPEYDDEVPMLQSMRKTKGKQKEGKAQKEINVKDDLELRERLDLYRTFLLFCLQGDTTGMPMGTSLVVQKDQSDFVRLGQLGDILGLNPMEVSSVHQGLAEQAFKVQAQTLLADGQLSKTRAEQLKAMQQQLGLPDEAAQKVIKSITSTKMAGAIDQAVKAGKLSVEDVKQLRESGVDIESMVGKNVREQMFKKLAEKALSQGTGEFDATEVFETLPADLGLDASAAKKMVTELATERTKSSLIQAISLLRQKKPELVVGALNDLLACDKAERSPEPLKWSVKEELLDLYSLFLAKNAVDGTNAVRLRELLDIDEMTAQSLADMVASGGFSLETSNEENFVF